MKDTNTGTMVKSKTEVAPLPGGKSSCPNFEDMVCSGKEYAKETPPFDHIARHNEKRPRETPPAKGQSNVLVMFIAAGLACSVYVGAQVVHIVAHPKQLAHKILHHGKPKK